MPCIYAVRACVCVSWVEAQARLLSLGKDVRSGSSSGEGAGDPRRAPDAICIWCTAPSRAARARAGTCSSQVWPAGTGCRAGCSCNSEPVCPIFARIWHFARRAFQARAGRAVTQLDIMRSTVLASKSCMRLCVHGCVQGLARRKVLQQVSVQFVQARPQRGHQCP